MFFIYYFATWIGFPLYPEIFYIITMILQHIRIIVADAGFQPGGLLTQKSGELYPNEPPHLRNKNVNREVYRANVKEGLKGRGETKKARRRREEQRRRVGRKFRMEVGAND